MGTADTEAVASTPLTEEQRVRKMLTQLRGVGPGDHEPLVAALLQQDPTFVIRSLREEFPGLLWFHRHVSHRRLPKGRDVGPLGALAYALGEEVLPMLASLLDDGHADQRYYAALVVSDLAETISEDACMDMISVLEKRVFDGDTQVRDVALHALKAFDRRHLIDDLAVRLVERAEDKNLNIGKRIIALKALGVLRHVPSIPSLIELLAARAPEVRNTSRQVLRAITATDKGTSRWRWRSWAKKNLALGRVSWLVAGLTHRDVRLRASAYQDLLRLTGHEIPFDPEGPSKERKRVRAEYEAWLAAQAASRS